LRADDSYQLQKSLRRGGACPFVSSGHLAAKRGKRAAVCGLVPVGSGKVVLSQNLNPDVSVMESAENRYLCDAAELLRPPKIRRILLQ
jgi:hypothetical protein